MDPQLLTALALNALAAAVIVALWIWARQTLRQHQGSEIAGYVATLVAAAEQQFATNPERRAWVIAQARERFPRLKTDILITLLEAAVYDLNRDQQETAALAMPIMPAQTWISAYDPEEG